MISHIFQFAARAVFAMLFMALLSTPWSAEAENARPVELRIATSEFAFSPASLRAVVGQPVTLILDNSNGETEHGVMFPRLGLRIFVRAGETAKHEYVFDRPGEYDFVCDLPGHSEAGMKGRLSVVAGDGGQPKRGDTATKN